MVSTRLKLPIFYYNVRDIQEQSFTGVVATVADIFQHRCSQKRSEYSRENVSAGVSFYETLLKRDSNTGVFL